MGERVPAAEGLGRMTPTEYAAEVNRTRRRTDADLSDQTYLIGHTLGLVGESGEVCDLVKKWFLHGHPFDGAACEKLIKELGDCLWYNVALRLDLDQPLPRWVAPSSKPDLLDIAKDALFSQFKAAKVALAAARGRTRSVFDRYEIVEALNEQIAELASIASFAGVDLAHVAAQNIAKLRARFPEGFTSAASVARVDAHTDAPIDECPCTRCTRITP